MSLFRSRFEGNEIILTDDQNNNGDLLVTNFDELSNIIGDTTIITGMDVTQTLTPSMGVAISAGVTRDGTLSQMLSGPDFANVTITASDPILDRYDIIEIRRLEDPITPETRQFKNPTTGAITSSLIDTEVEYTIEVNVLAGTPGGIAPSTTSGYVKIAEILVPNAAITIVNADIFNVDAIKEGVSNTGWTADQQSIYRNGTISEMKTLIVENEELIDDIIQGTQHLVSVNTDTINESTTGAGVTVDSVLLKDENVSCKYINLKDPNEFSLEGSGLSISGIGIPALAALNSTDVAFVDTSNDDLRTYRFDGSIWSLLGSELSISGISSPALTRLNSTDIAFVDGGFGQLRTYRFDGSTWSLVGSGLAITIVSPTISALSSTDIALIDTNNDELRTYRFDGSTWSLVGSGLAITVADPALTALSALTVALIDSNNNSLRTYRFDGSTWALIGSGLSITVASPTISTLSSTDIALIDTNNDELRTYRFDGSTWALIGSGLSIPSIADPTISALSSTNISFIDSNSGQLRNYNLSFVDFPPSAAFG